MRGPRRHFTHSKVMAWVGVDRMARVMRREGGLLLRYRNAESDDGLPGGEGVFLACSFWLVDAL